MIQTNETFAAFLPEAVKGLNLTDGLQGLSDLKGILNGTQFDNSLEEIESIGNITSEVLEDIKQEIQNIGANFTENRNDSETTTATLQKPLSDIKIQSKVIHYFIRDGSMQQRKISQRH